MPTYIEMEKRTPYTILRTKYLDHIEKHGILPTLRHAGTGLAAVIVGFWWSYPDSAINIFWAIFGIGNFLILKVIMVAFLFFGFPAIFDSIMDEVSERIEKTDWAKIWGVSVVEIVGYIFDNESFPRDEVMAAFAISRSQYTEIAKLLDKNNIFVRGENNGRVLNSNLTRQMIVDILMGGGDRRAEIIGDRFDFLQDLRDKVSSLFTPAPRFERRKI